MLKDQNCRVCIFAAFPIMSLDGFEHVDGKMKIKEKDNNSESVAYLQVKDLTKNDNEKVFIFNGWTFSEDPTLAPFDHAIYDLQLVDCNNV